MAFELFVEVTRNNAVESRHFGSAVVCNAAGKVLHQWGDIDELIFPRSSIKPMLAIQIIESGACDKYNLSDAELSLACSSHLGEQIHQDLVTSWLARLGLNEQNLACGPALPEHIKSAHHLLAQGQHGCRVHHNCSGKHTGYLTTALHLGLPTNNYHELEHPLQQLSLQVLSEMAGVDVASYPMGIDGCGLPAPTMPLVKLGYAMARFADPSGLSAERSKAIYRLHQAIINEPLYICGHGSVVSELNEATKGSVLVKNGAEGIIIAALPKRGLGIAVKIADGNSRALSVSLLAILDHLGELTSEHKQQLQEHIKPTIINSRGLAVGEVRAAASWMKSDA